MRVGVSAGIASRAEHMGWSATGERHARLSIPLPEGKYKTDEEIFTYYIPQNIKDKGYFEVKTSIIKLPTIPPSTMASPSSTPFISVPFSKAATTISFLPWEETTNMLTSKTDCSNSLHSRKT